MELRREVHVRISESEGRVYREREPKVLFVER